MKGRDGADMEYWENLEWLEATRKGGIKYGKEVTSRKIVAELQSQNGKCREHWFATKPEIPKTIITHMHIIYLIVHIITVFVP